MQCPFFNGSRALTFYRYFFIQGLINESGSKSLTAEFYGVLRFCAPAAPEISVPPYDPIPLVPHNFPAASQSVLWVLLTPPLRLLRSNPYTISPRLLSPFCGVSFPLGSPSPPASAAPGQLMLRRSGSFSGDAASMSICNFTMLMAAAAASSPLLPRRPPQRSSACCMSFTVKTPKEMGMFH